MEINSEVKDLHSVVVDLLEELESPEDVWKDLQNLPVEDEELDLLIVLLENSEDKVQDKLAEEIANGIHTPTLEDDLMRRKSNWYDNDRCNQHASFHSQLKYEKRWLQLFDRLYPDSTLFMQNLLQGD